MLLVYRIVSHIAVGTRRHDIYYRESMGIPMLGPIWVPAGPHGNTHEGKYFESIRSRPVPLEVKVLLNRSTPGK